MTGNIETGQYMEQCGYGMPIDIVHALNRQASQENCDGDPYDAMVFAGEYITALRAEITQLRAELSAEREAREASEEWADIGINLFSEILYEFDACMDDGELTDDPMENYLIIIRQAIKNATRRNK